MLGRTQYQIRPNARLWPTKQGFRVKCCSSGSQEGLIDVWSLGCNMNRKVADSQRTGSTKPALVYYRERNSKAEGLGVFFPLPGNTQHRTLQKVCRLFLG